MNQYKDTLDEAYKVCQGMVDANPTLNSNHLKRIIGQIFRVLYAQRERIRKIQYIKAAVSTVKKKETTCPEGYVDMPEYVRRYPYISYDRLNLYRKHNPVLNALSKKVAHTNFIKPDEYNAYFHSKEAAKLYPKLIYAMKKWEKENVSK